MSHEDDNLCCCYWPEKILLLPGSPAVIDKESGEFRWKNTDNEGYIVFKFCPECGFEMPVCTRDFVSPGIPKEEYLRLQNTLLNIKDIDALIERYGEPDGNETYLYYEKKSKAATIRVHADWNNKIQINLSQKPIKDSKK